MKGLTFKRFSILGIVLLVASVATAFITKDKKDVRANGHLTQDNADSSTDDTCRPAGGDVVDCNDTQNAGGSSSAGGTALTDDGATSDGVGANTTKPD